MSGADAEWTDDKIARLRALWAEGLSTAEIGRRMNLSKNSVVGKAHRLNLPSRPSPIRKAGDGVERRPVIVKPVASRAEAARVTKTEASPALPPPVTRVGPSGRCMWPLGDPGRPGFRFCGDDSVAGKPYCRDHAAIAFVRVRDTREDVA